MIHLCTVTGLLQTLACSSPIPVRSFRLILCKRVFLRICSQARPLSFVLVEDDSSPFSIRY